MDSGYIELSSVIMPNIWLPATNIGILCSVCHTNKDTIINYENFRHQYKIFGKMFVLYNICSYGKGSSSNRAQKKKNHI